MASQIVKHMNEHSLLYDLQHGFREKRSCETQLTMLVEDLARSASKRPVTPSGVSTALARCSLIFRNAVRSQEIPDAFLEKAPATASSQ